MANLFKVEQITEVSTTSSTFVDVPGTTLTFSPSHNSQTWAIFVTGKSRSTSTSERAYEIILDINGVESDIWSHQNSSSTTPNHTGFFIFDRITGTTAVQTIKLRFRTIGTCFLSSIRIVCALIPQNSDFQYSKSAVVTNTTGSNVVIGSLTFTPSSPGDYLVFGKVSHREFPAFSTSQVQFEAVGSADPLHPNAPVGVGYSMARDSWNPSTCVWLETLGSGSQTFNIRFTSSGAGTESSQHTYRKLMVFRVDAWEKFDYSYSRDQSTTTSGSFTSKNSLTTSPTTFFRNTLSIQCARISGDSTSSTAQKSGQLRIGGSIVMRTDQRISRNGSADQGYHHTIGCVNTNNTNSGVTYENGFLSPNGIRVQMAESTIVVLRYPPMKNTHQLLM